MGDWSSIGEEAHSDYIFLSTSEPPSRVGTGLESGRNSAEYAHPDASILFQSDINSVQNLVSTSSQPENEQENASSFTEDDTSSSADTLSYIAEGEDAEIRSVSPRADLDPTSEAMQSAHDIFTLREAEEVTRSHAAAVAAVGESSEAMRSARSMYNAGYKADCDSDSDESSSSESDESVSSSVSSMSSQMREIEIYEEEFSSSETDDDEETSEDAFPTSEEEVDGVVDTCFDLDALFAEVEHMDIEGIATEHESLEPQLIASNKDLSTLDSNAAETCPFESPFVELSSNDESDTVSEASIMEELERMVLEQLEGGEIGIDLDSIPEEFLDMDPVRFLQCMTECEESEDDDGPSPTNQNEETIGKSKKRRWLNLKKIWSSKKSRIFSFRKSQSNDRAKATDRSSVVF